MARGFLSGAIWGGVFSLGVAAVASVLAPPPQPPEVTADAPGGAEAPDVAQVAEAQTETSIDTGDDAPTPAAAAPAAVPDPDTLSALSDAAQAPAVIPQTGSADGLAEPARPAEEGAVTPQEDAPVLPNPLALAPMAPQAADELSISTEPAQPPIPQETGAATAFDDDAPRQSTEEETAGAAEDTLSATAPQVSQREPEAPSAPEVQTETAFATPSDTPQPEQAQTPAPTPPAPAEDAPVASVVETPAAPLTPPATGQAAVEGTETAADEGPVAAADEGTEEAPVVVAEQVPEGGTDAATEEAEVAMVAPTSRPQIGRPAISLTDRDSGVAINRPTDAPTPPQNDAGAESADAEVLPEGPPVQRFAQTFENPDNKPVMSIVLIDDGTSPTSGQAGVAALKSFPNAISFAVDAALPDAADRMAIYRAEGFEVLAMVDLPAGAQASDAEISLTAVLAQMSEVVGVLEGTETGLQQSRSVSDQVTAILASSGHGLLTQNRGLNTMPKLARKEGVPAAPIFRDFDSKGQTATVIRRFLDQAAFKAGQEGAVVMLGRLRPDTISALLLWGLQDRAGQVAIAPVTAVLTREEG